jgi:phosphoribosylaminoimidazole-succinocarboxamide synthase
MKGMKFTDQTSFYSGKVRDVYTISDRWLVMVASDRISAFDVILPQPIPFKGQVLNQIAAYMLNATKDICPNWLLSCPAPQVSIGKKCIPYKIEMVVRGNLTGHAWRTYQKGLRVLCGVPLPENMKENDAFPHPIITPSTKASEGHDEDISKEEIIATGLCTPAEWETLSQYALALFARGQEIASNRNLILADTKYEFGKIDDQITLMDEIHTPDSSRYFLKDGFEERQSNSEKQKQLSKEFVREWLIANHFMGKESQQVPHMSPEWIGEISGRYIELYGKLIGKPFEPVSLSDDETISRIEAAIAQLT